MKTSEMKKLFVTAFIVASLSPCLIAQMVTARVVALYEASDFRMSTHEPKQAFVIETKNNKSSERSLLKVIYWVPTNGLRGGATFLEPMKFRYENLWKLELTQPDAQESYWCKRIDNLLTSRNGKVVTDSRKAPILLFRSTQFEGNVTFDKISEMPCMVVKSLDKS